MTDSGGSRENPGSFKNTGSFESAGSLPNAAPASLRVLLHGLIDYAGLFPPAKLDMPKAVAVYARSIIGPYSGALARFICPVSKLELFHAAASAHLPRGNDDEPWRLSAIIDGDLDENLDAIFAFNHEHSEPESGLAVADVVEIKIAKPSEIDDALDLLPEEIYPYFEIPVKKDAVPDVRGYLTAIAGNEAAAKIRTGGVTPELFPATSDIAYFLSACAAAQVPFKATAGLHHPVRAEHPLTYEQNPPRGVMHGFCNLFIAAAAAWSQDLEPAELDALLNITDPAKIAFTDSGAKIGDIAVPLDDLLAARNDFCRSYGSCSFDEPIADLAALGWLPRVE